MRKICLRCFSRATARSAKTGNAEATPNTDPGRRPNIINRPKFEAELPGLARLCPRRKWGGRTKTKKLNTQPWPRGRQDLPGLPLVQPEWSVALLDLAAK